jgi:HTH-type transcriptional regulator, competence development regulator
MKTFGQYIRERRETLNSKALTETAGRRYSLRAVAQAVDVQPSYLSKVEVGQVPPSDELVTNLASVLDEDVDVLMAMAGKVSKELQAIIVRRPEVFGELLRALRDAPEDAILRVVREVRDGQW